MARKNPHAVALGRRGGSVTSAAKTHAARSNGKKGGRRPKCEVGDRVIGREDGPASYRGRTGTVKAHTDRGEYRVHFDDAPGVDDHVMSWWIDVVEP